MLEATIESEEGTLDDSPPEDVSALSAILPSYKHPRFKCLCFIDHLGVILFNELQLEVLKTEIPLMMKESVSQQAMVQ